MLGHTTGENGEQTDERDTELALKNNTNIKSTQFNEEDTRITSADETQCSVPLRVQCEKYASFKRYSQKFFDSLPHVSYNNISY